MSAFRNLRALLRASRTLDASVPAGALSWADYVMQQYRAGADAEPVRAAQMRQQAADMLGYLHELKEQRSLHNEFGGEKLTQRERIKRTAGMVGLNMDQGAIDRDAEEAAAASKA